MRLSPRYDGPPVVRFTGPVGDPSVPLLRQRRRLGEVLGGLDDEQWATASRCEGWSVRDVVAHLVGADQYWVISASGALAGTPTRYLEGFDPVAVPAQMVAAMHEGPAEVLALFRQGVDALAACLTGLDEQQWTAVGEAPPGHVPLHALVRHALWDGWVHERDIALPLGLNPVEEPDEVLASLQYAAAVGPALLAMNGETRRGTLAFVGTDPDAHVVVEVGGETAVVGDGDPPPGAVRVEGRSVELVEALSFRAPFPHDVDDEHRWLLDGLAAAFDLT